MRTILLLCLTFAISGLFARECGSTVDLGRESAVSTISGGQFGSAGQWYRFRGLASYLNGVNFYLVGKEGIRSAVPGETVALANGMWFAVVGRFKIVLVQNRELAVPPDAGRDAVESFLAGLGPNDMEVVGKSELSSKAPELGQLRYAHLWAPFAWLAKLVESLLRAIHRYAAGDWGLAIVGLTVMVNIVLAPVHYAVARVQDDVSRIRSSLEPELARIRADYRGEEAHRLIMAAHGSLGISPFYSLKPLLGVFVQVPVWVAVFNVLGEIPELAGHPFLWIEDLAYPDVVAVLPFDVPLVGSNVHLFPFVMAAVACLSIWTLRSERWSARERSRQRLTQYGLATVFLFLFYPFPAAMVLYWTVNIVLTIFMRWLQQPVPSIAGDGKR